MKSWSSSSGSSDTAGRTRWARACHAQPRWLLWLRLPRIGPSPRGLTSGVQAAPSPGNSALPQQVPFPALSIPSLPPLPAFSGPGAKALVRLYIPEPTPGGAEGPPGAGAADP